MAEIKTVKKAPKATKTPTKKVAKKATPKASKAPKTGLYAVFATGGKQYRVQEGDSVKIEKILGNHTEGDKITFSEVLLTDDGKGAITLGTPFIKGASVTATLEKIDRDKKIEVIQYKQKSRYFKRYGHRQPFFKVKIESIK